MAQWWPGRSKADRRRHKFEKQGGACHWCGRQMTLEFRPNGTPPKNFATFEHVVRRCEGGAGMANNVVVACRKCNNSRGNGVPEVAVEQRGWEFA